MDDLEYNPQDTTTAERPYAENSLPSKQPKRFYEMSELKDFNAVLNQRDPIKIFICTFCGQWNKIHESQLRGMDEMARHPRMKKVIHMEVDEDLFIGWNKFKANFGTHERAIAVALSEWYKHNR
jgi:hypothetical protein